MEQLFECYKADCSLVTTVAGISAGTNVISALKTAHESMTSPLVHPLFC